MAKVSMSDVWDSAAAFLKDKGVALIPVALLAYWIPGAFNALLQDQKIEDLKQAAGSAPVFFFPGWVNWFNLPLLLLTIWGGMTITAHVLERMPPAQVALRRLPAAILVWLVTLLAALLVFGLLFAVFLLILKAGGVSPTAFIYGSLYGGSVGATVALKGLSPVVGLLLFLLMLLVFCALLWLTARLALMTPTIVEGRGLDAFVYSFVRTRGMALRMIGVMLLYGIVLFIVSLAVTGVFGTIFRLILGGSGPMSPAGLLTIAVAALAHAGFGVIAAVFVAKLYLALSDRPAMAGE